MKPGKHSDQAVGTPAKLIITPMPLAEPPDGPLAVFEPIIMELLISSIRWDAPVHSMSLALKGLTN